MCGIVGWIDFQRSLLEPQALDVLQKMNDSQIHRGPDGEGIFSTPHLLFAHRRLSIIEPQKGHQPMSCQWQGRNYTLVYNGEIYNAPTLSRQLKKAGYPISTRSDTEILLWSYIHDPENFLPTLEGMFAFAIWDDHKQQLLLARDPLGIKPLFWARIDTGWGFASEVKTLLQHPSIEPILDTTSLNELWTLFPSRTPGLSPFSTIQEIRPGYQLQITKEKTTMKPFFQWESHPHQDDADATMDYVCHRLQKAVNEQMAADVPVGAMLSGGIDSSFLCSLAQPWYQEHRNKNLHTYSIDDGEYEKHFEASSTQPDTDTRWVAIMSDYLGSEHLRVSPSAKELIDALPEASYARDMPGMADVDASLLLFSRVMRKEVTVVLSGEGADEIFCGYPWFQDTQNPSSPNSLETFPWMSNSQQRSSFLRPIWRDRLQSMEYLTHRYREACAEVQTLEEETEQESRLRVVTYLTLTRWLPMLLERKDRMTMAASLEARVPFCDIQLAQYLWNVPWSIKNYQGRTKGLLREVCQGILPDTIRLRPKNPYPRTHNPVYYRTMQQKISNIMKDKTSPLHEFLDPKAIEPLLQSNASTKFSWFGQIMQAPSLLAHWLQLDTWWRKYNIKIVN